MRKPHEHQYKGSAKRFACNNPECKLPFVVAQIKPPTPRMRRFIKERYASREVQHARYIDCGPLNWDDQ